MIDTIDVSERWVHLMLETAQEVLPEDAELQARFADYIRWGAQTAVAASQPGFEIQHVGPVSLAFFGRFIVHGGAMEVREGSWPGNLVIIEFPTLAHARDWYDSPEYRAILPLRTRHIDSDSILVEGVEPNHDSAALAAQLRAAGWGQAPSMSSA